MVKSEPAYVGLTPILLELAGDLASLQPGVKTHVAELRTSLFLELGVRFPEVTIRHHPALSEGAYRILLNEVWMGTSVVRPGMVLADETVEWLRERGHDCIHAVNPSTRANSGWVAKALAAGLEEQGLTLLTPAQVVSQHLEQLLRRHARSFVKVQLVQDMLDGLAAEAPALVQAIVPSVISLLQLTELLGRLVEEELSIRNLPAILQAIAEGSRPNPGTMRLTEEVRASMREYVSNKYARGRLLSIYLLDPKIEEAIRSAITWNPDGTSHLALEPELAQEIVQAVREEVGLLSGRDPQPLILTAMDIRRYVRKLLEYEFNPPFHVVSYQELSPDLNIQPISRISLG